MKKNETVAEQLSLFPEFDKQKDSLKELKSQLLELKSQKKQLDQAIFQIENYLNQIESKVKTFENIKTKSFQDIEETLLKDST